MALETVPSATLHHLDDPKKPVRRHIRDFWGNNAHYARAGVTFHHNRADHDELSRQIPPRTLVSIT